MENLNEIFAEWNNDSEIDENNLDKEVLKISKLINKYQYCYIKSTIKLIKLKAEYNKLYTEKYNYYCNGITETKDLKRSLPYAPGISNGKNPENYIQADPEFIKISIERGILEEQINLLKEIIDIIKKRTFVIRDAIEWRKFIEGQ